jgi:ribosomal protein S1
MSESFADLFEESLNTIEMAPGSIVTGTVVDIDDDWVVVHAGLKSEGVIPKNQFLNEEGVCTLNVGDQVKVAMEVVDDGFGETRLSRAKIKPQYIRRQSYNGESTLVIIPSTTKLKLSKTPKLLTSFVIATGFFGLMFFSISG